MLGSDKLDEKQNEALEKAKDLLAGVLQPMWDDVNLLRWLIARDFDPVKAVKMLKMHLEWRKMMGMDKLKEYTPPDICVKYLMGDPNDVVGYDKEGSEIRVICRGQFDMKGLLSSTKKTDITKYAAYTLEIMYRKSIQRNAENGNNSRQSFDIIDLNGYGMDQFWKPGLDMIGSLFAMAEANYPETSKKIIIINAPAIFPIVFAVVGPFLSAKTKKKIKVFGRKYQSELLKYVDADELPMHYGGTKTGPDGDAKCSHVICYAGKIPIEYYSATDQSKREEFKEISVKHGTSEQLEFHVPKPGSALRWQFITEGYDIGFGVFKKTEEGQDLSEMTVVMDTMRVSSHLLPEDGCVTLDVPGTYVLLFDNTYSWARAKKILYVADVMEPSDEFEVLECTHF